MLEPPRVADHVPVTGEAVDCLHGEEINVARAQDVVRRFRVVIQPESFGVPVDRRAPQTLEDAELDLVWFVGDQLVETFGEVFQRVAGQAKDQVGVDIGLGLLSQPQQVLTGFPVVLPAADQALYLGIKRLDADLELQGVPGESFYHLPQSIRQVVRHDFEMQIQVVAHARQEKFHDGDTGADFQVERAVYEFEIARAALVQIIHGSQESFQFERRGSLVQRRQTEFAFERTAARGFDIDHAVLDVLVAVTGVRQLQLIERDDLALDDLCSGDAPCQQLRAELPETDLARPLDHIIGKPGHVGMIGKVTDFRPAQHDDRLRSDLFYQGDDLADLFHVPDVNAKTDDGRLMPQDLLDDIERALVDGEFFDAGARLQIAQIGVQITQSKRSMDVTGVERGE